MIQGDFFNWASPENVSRLAPPRNPSTGPPLNLLSMRITKHLDFFSIIRGGQSGTLPFFLNWLLTGQHLANSREAQLKKSVRLITLYHPRGLSTRVQTNNKSQDLEFMKSLLVHQPPLLLFEDCKPLPSHLFLFCSSSTISLFFGQRLEGILFLLGVCLLLL